MPVTVTEARDAERNDDNERDRERSGNKSKGSSSKTKDLSHVPCKFFKVGSCTAGAACPFSHAASTTPGAPKDVCAWYVKGNCKFGHKCALAHIMPGQSMSMDRKNKKAAQVAAQSANGGSGPNPKERRGRKESARGSMSTNPLLPGGSTAPTRMRGAPGSLKAALSPSAPAPPLKDTEFAALVPVDDGESKLASAPALTSDAPLAEAAESKVEEEVTITLPPSEPAPESAVAPAEREPLPFHSPTAPRQLITSRSPPQDFGPIGSPPRSASSTHQHTPSRGGGANGLSPGTSPRNGAGAGMLSTSPFSAPGTSTVFMHGAPSSPPAHRSGIAASLGAWGASSPPARLQAHSHAHTHAVLDDNDDDDFEAALPSSLNDLLTPEEIQRRMSRTKTSQNNQHPPLQPPNNPSMLSAGGGQQGLGTVGGYSRSVPAPSLLGDIKSIWSDANAGNATPRSPERGAGTPGSFSQMSMSPSGGSGLRAQYPDDPHAQSLSPSSAQQFGHMMGPTNASAAFLNGPNLHQSYLNAKLSGQRPSGLGHGLGANGTGAGSRLSATPPSMQNGPFLPNGASALSPPRARPPFETHPSDPYLQPPGQQSEAEAVRALQAHLPGQSLPQGLAAGYSRIHALPPPPAIPSPSSSAFGGVGSPLGVGVGSPLGGGLGVDASTSLVQPPGATGLENHFSRLSYSAAASRPGQGAPPAPQAQGVPPGMQRQPSSGAPRPWAGQGQGQGGPGGPLSPLSKPVAADDDDLFSMDG